MSSPSYPAPVYDGDTGLVNARLRPAGTEPEVRYKNGGTAEYLATGESTGDQFGLYRWNMSPARAGPIRISTARSPSRSS